MRDERTGADSQAKVFISYSRKDIEAAERLRDWLAAIRFQVYLDTQDIFPGEPWQDRLARLIEAADTVVFLLSPNSASSEICDWEVGEAERQSKRILAVVIRDVSPSEAPERLRRLNWLFIRNASEERTGGRLLLQALHTDIAWIREHTRLGELAAEWNRAKRSPEHLLRGTLLEAAELWMSRRPRGAPGPGEVQLLLIQESRKAEIARIGRERDQLDRTRLLQRRSAWALAGVGVLVLLGLGIALWQARETEKREVIVSASLAHRAIVNSQYELAMRVALQRLPIQDGWPLSLGWHDPEVRALEAKLAGAAQLSPLLLHLEDGGDAMRSVAFSPNGRRIFISSERGSRVLDANTGDLLFELKGYKRLVHSAAFSSDGSRIVTGSHDRTARIWSAKDGEQLFQFKEEAGTRGTAFSADGTRVLTVSGNSAWLWNTSSGALFRELRGQGAVLNGAAISPDGTLVATAAPARTVRVWDASSGAQLVELAELHRAEGLAFSPDGDRIVTRSDDGRARIWDARTGRKLLELSGHDGAIYVANFSSDGQWLLTGSSDTTVRIWNSRTGAQIGQLNGHRRGILSAEFSRDGRRIITGSEDGTARVWQYDSLAPLMQIKTRPHTISSAVFSRDGSRILVGSGNYAAQVLDSDTGREILLLQTMGEVVNAAFSSDNSRIVTASNYSSSGHVAQVWDARTGARIAELKGHKGFLWSAQFNPDASRVVTASDDRTARVWDVQLGTQLLELAGETEVKSAAFSEDGSRIVTGDTRHGIVRVWNSGSGAKIAEFKAGYLIRSATFSTDGLRILTGSFDGLANIWDARSGERIVHLRGHTGPVLSAAFSPDGQRVATGSMDGTARVWDAVSGAQLAELRGHPSWAKSAAFSADGSRIITASGDSLTAKGVPTARIWDATWLVNIRGPELVRRVCAEKLLGTTKLFTSGDALDPILTGLAGTNPCDRAGSLSPMYWIERARHVWRKVGSSDSPSQEGPQKN